MSLTPQGFGKTDQSADPASQETCLAPSSCSLPGMAGCSGVNRDGDVLESPRPFFATARRLLSQETFMKSVFFSSAALIALAGSALAQPSLEQVSNPSGIAEEKIAEKIVI